MQDPFTAMLGGDNMPDAGGEGAPPVPAPSSIPSVAAPAPAPAGPPPVDPRLQAALQGLQPKPPPTGWQAVLQRLAPVLGAAFAMRTGSGGSFVNEYGHLQQQQQEQADRHARAQLEFANILHQQEMERLGAQQIVQREQARASAERIAIRKIEAAAAKEREKELDQTLRKEYENQLQGGTLAHANEIAQSEGKDAADRYLASWNVGTLSEQGIHHTLKDLVDKYAVRSPETGEISLGKTKTPKEAKAGTSEDFVTMAETIAEQKAGRPLTDQERMDVDATALKRYKGLTKDPDAAEMTHTLKQLQIDLATQEKERRQQQIDKGYEDQYGGSVSIFQHPDGTIHGYILDKTNRKLIEVPAVLPPGSSRIQPPSAWQKFLNLIGAGNAAPPPVVKIGGGLDPTDPNWGK